MTETEVEQAIYTMRWSKEALDAMIETFNRNDVRGHQGELLRMELVDHGRGDVSFLITAEYPKQET